MLCIFFLPYPISLLDITFMAHNNDQTKGIQGATLGEIPIELYCLEIQHFVNSTLNKIFELLSKFSHYISLLGKRWSLNYLLNMYHRT